MTQTETQSHEILEFLKTGQTLTQLEALKKFQCLRLGARIYDLRKKGHLIDSKQITVSKGKRVAQYSLINARA